MNGPWDFWNGYYRWSISTPLHRAMRQFSDQVGAVADEIGHYLLPTVKKANRAFQDFFFSLWLSQQPRWQRPFMRLAYRIERLVLR